MPTNIDLSNGLNKYRFDINWKNILLKLPFDLISSGTTLLDPSNTCYSLSGLLQAIADNFSEEVDVKKKLGVLSWQLLLNSIKKTSDSIQKELNNNAVTTYGKTYSFEDFFIRNIQELKLDNIFITKDFFNRPDRAGFYAEIKEIFLSWLKHSNIDDKSLNKASMIFQYFYALAVNSEICENYDEYKALIENEFLPTMDYVNELSQWRELGAKYKGSLNNSIYFDNMNLIEFYVSLNIKWFSKSAKNSDPTFEVLKAEEFFDQWLETSNDNFCIVCGEPGSGKSSVLKKMAWLWAESCNKVIYVPLNDGMMFYSSEPPVEVINRRIKKISPTNYNQLSEADNIILILDGLDEAHIENINITNFVGSFIKNIVTSDWCRGTNKVIVSGRSNLFDKNRFYLHKYTYAEILPLYIDIDEGNLSVKYRNKEILQDDLRYQLWAVLSILVGIDFNIEAPVFLQNKELDDLTRNPLLSFLLAWVLGQNYNKLLDIDNKVVLYVST